jgi:hypothetical protein
MAIGGIAKVGAKLLTPARELLNNAWTLAANNMTQFSYEMVQGGSKENFIGSCSLKYESKVANLICLLCAL